jgi:putative flavoprotein involved in K+ transport
MDVERFDTIVIGAGQAGLSAGAFLQRAGRSFVILDAGERVGDTWRQRYDSLRLFTPPRYIGLPGSRIPSKDGRMPTKDELADYLEAYAAETALPVRSAVRVDGVRREGEHYLVTAGAAHRERRVPAFAHEFDPSIVQLHSSEYKNPSQLRDGGVLVVGAGNSGADISLELSGTHPTWLSGPERGHIPPDIDTWIARHIAFPVIRFIGVHVLTLRTPMGRKALAKMARQGDPLVRVKPRQLVAAGVERVPKTVAARGGAPVLEDGSVLDVANVIWCTGFSHDLSWIDLPIFGEDGRPMHERGVVTSEPGLYFVGLPFQFAVASDVLPGVGRDAAYVVKQLRRRSRELVPAEVVAV